MEFTKISRSLSYEMVNGFGLKLWDKLGAEMEVKATDNPKDGYAAMKEMIEEVHQESFPNVQSILVHDSHELVPEKQVDKPTKTMIEEMEACDTYTDIKSFQFTIKNEQEKAVYERKLTELSPKN